ncbi:MAG: PorT family protein [Muribaculaceae bacterium]|nr:PorT family protein [Muribaculaceae bacterium]
MKKITIALLCMIMATGSALAQKQFTFGPKVGVDYTHFWGKKACHGGRLNYQAGLFLEYRFTDKISIAPEVVFAAQGGKYDYKNFIYEMIITTDVELTDMLNYINIPVMFKYYFTPKFSIDFGPQLGINIYSKYSVEPKDKAIGPKMTHDQKDGTKTLDVGVGLGLTYNITNDVFVQGRYTMGVTDVFDKNWDSDEEKNANAQIAIGYRF